VTLRYAHITAFGREAHYVLEGDRGKVRVALSTDQIVPRQDPCPDCEHAGRCETGKLGVDGCPSGEAWRAPRQHSLFGGGGS